MNPLLRYRFLRRNGWNKADATTAILIFSGKFLGKFSK